MLSGTILIGGAGAVTSSTGEKSTNPVVKTAAKTGRYTIAFLRKYKNVRIGSLELIGPTDAALTSTDGNDLFARNVTGSGFEIQARQTSYADANPASGNSIHWVAYGQL